jgi:hypothetical protein
MTRCGRRSPSDDAQVVRVARERDDIDTNIGWPVCRPDGCRGRLCERRACPDRILRSHLHARSKTYVSEQQIVYPPSRTRETGPIGPNRAARATDSIGTLLAQNASATRASSQRIRSQRKTARATERNHRMPDRFASVERPCVRGPVGAMKRRSGIVRRPAAPDSASAASERCRGRKPQERRPISNRAVGGRHSVSSPEVAAGRAGRA